MNRDYYNEYYDIERTHWWFKVREKIIIQRLTLILGPQQNLKFLNVGAATGRSTEALSKLGTVTSLEFDKDCCDFTKSKLGIKMINGSITALPFDSNYFDVVCAFDVIEHVEDQALAVKEMKRVCKHEGIIYVTVPAFMFLWSHHDLVNQHYRRYTSKTLADVFNTNELKKLYLTYFNTLLFLPIYFFRKISKVIPQSWIRKESGSDFKIKNQSVILNYLLGGIFKMELTLLKIIRFPFGVSLLALWRK